MIDPKPEAAIDATGLETHHASAHYGRRGGGPQRSVVTHEAWPKLTAVFHTTSHLIAGAVTCRGPSQDSPQFEEAMRSAAAHLRPVRLLADKGYDAEHNHRLCRKELGVKTTAIALNPRAQGRRWPATPYRRLMKTCFPKRKYRQRCQAESGFSRHKRRLGSALSAKREDRQYNELRMRVLTHNLMLLGAHA